MSTTVDISALTVNCAKMLITTVTICEVSSDMIILVSLAGHSSAPETLVPPVIKNIISDKKILGQIYHSTTRVYLCCDCGLSIQRYLLKIAPQILTLTAQEINFSRQNMTTKVYPHSVRIKILQYLGYII